MLLPIARVWDTVLALAKVPTPTATFFIPEVEGAAESPILIEEVVVEFNPAPVPKNIFLSPTAESKAKLPVSDNLVPSNTNLLSPFIELEFPVAVKILLLVFPVIVIPPDEEGISKEISSKLVTSAGNA